MKNITHSTPNWLCGNNPGYDINDPGRGNVTVPEDGLDEALRYLMRRATILAVKEHSMGLVIQYRLKTHDKAFAILRKERMAV